MMAFKTKAWQKLLTKEWIIKFISLCLAVVLWYFVGGEDIVDKNVMIPVEVINLPRDLVISNQFKKEIEVAVSGPRSSIMAMGKREITRQIDLSDATPGTMVIANDNNTISVSRGVTVLRIQPSSIILSLDKLVQKQFPINPVISGTVAPGYVLDDLRIDPDIITITGPQTVLSHVDVLRTTVININDMRESIQKQIPLDLDPDIVDLIGETSVTADLVIAMETEQKKIKNLPVEVVIEGVVQKVEPAVVTVTANIPKILLNKKLGLNSLLSVTAVDEHNDGVLTVKVIPADNITVPIEVVEISPPTVTLKDTPQQQTESN